MSRKKPGLKYVIWCIDPDTQIIKYWGRFKHESSPPGKFRNPEFRWTTSSKWAILYKKLKNAESSIKFHGLFLDYMAGRIHITGTRDLENEILVRSIQQS